jgi:hypothetical protein
MPVPCLDKHRQAPDPTLPTLRCSRGPPPKNSHFSWCVQNKSGAQNAVQNPQRTFGCTRQAPDPTLPTMCCRRCAAYVDSPLPLDCCLDFNPATQTCKPPTITGITAHTQGKPGNAAKCYNHTAHCSADADGACGGEMPPAADPWSSPLTHAPASSTLPHCPNTAVPGSASVAQGPSRSTPGIMRERQRGVPSKALPMMHSQHTWIWYAAFTFALHQHTSRTHLPQRPSCTAEPGTALSPQPLQVYP